MNQSNPKSNAHLNKTIHAVIIGIETYDKDEKKYPPLDGPARDAMNFAQWLVKGGVPPGNIRLLISAIPKNKSYLDDILKENGEKNLEYKEPDFSNIQSCLVNDISQFDQNREDNFLYFFWAGHGFVDFKDRESILLLSNYHHEKSPYHLRLFSVFSSFELPNAKTTVRPERLTGFKKQIYFIDACQNYSDFAREINPQNNALELHPQNPQKGEHRGGYSYNKNYIIFATRQGQIAEEQENTGVFSNELMKILTPEGENILIDIFSPYNLFVDDNMDKLKDKVSENLKQRQKPEPYAIPWGIPWIQEGRRDYVSFIRSLNGGGGQIDINWREMSIEIQRTMDNKRREICQKKLRGNPNIINEVSPLHIYWEKFINETPWHEKIIDLFNEVAEAIENIIIDLSNNDLNLQVNKNIFTEFKKLIHQTQESCLHENYYIVIDRIQELFNTERCNQFNKELTKLNNHLINKNDRQSINLKRNREKIKENIENFNRIILTPHFNKCFLILGSFGTGKTHFIHSILEEKAFINDNKNLLYILVDLKIPINGSIEDAIVQELSNYNFNPSICNNLEKINDVLQNNDPPIKLIIFIDDCEELTHHNVQEQRSFKEKLENCIQDHTKLHFIYWIITLLDTSYDQFTEKFWQEYSFFGNQIEKLEKSQIIKEQNSAKLECFELGGWIYLDYLNSSQEIGVNIIFADYEKQQVEEESSFDWSRTQDDLRQMIRPEDFYYISNPWVAWIIVNSKDKHTLEEVLLFSFTDFFVLFQEELKSTIYESDSTQSKRILERKIIDIIQHIICRTINHGLFSSCLDDIVNSFVEENIREVPAELKPSKAMQYQNEINKYIKLLCDLNLLETIDDPDCSNYYRINILFESFWLWNFIKGKLTSKSLKINSNLIDDILTWIVVVENTYLQEKVLLFFLFLIDSVTNEEETEMTFSNILENLLENISADSIAPIYFAGVNLKPVNQDYLSKILKGNDNLLNSFSNDKHTLFSFLYFVYQNQVQKISERFYLTSNFYSQISNNSLSSYFSFFAHKLLINEQNLEEIISCIGYLEGCERVSEEIACSLAETVIDKIYKIIFETYSEALANNEIKNIMDNFIYKKIINCLTEIDKINKNRISTRTQERWRRFYFREWFLHYFFLKSISFSLECREKQPNIFHKLLTKNWFFYSNIHQEIINDMHREANIAMGGYIRNNCIVEGRLANDETTEFFKNILQKLINKGSTVKDAFYIIYHTEKSSVQTNSGRQNIIPIVSIDFHDFLKQIGDDRKFKHLRQNNKDIKQFYEKNKIYPYSDN